MVLLALSAATIATASLASKVSLPVMNAQMRAVMLDSVSNDVEPNGDPVDGGGGAPT